MVRINDPIDVFERIDTKGGDITQCWPWTGKLQGRDDRPYISVEGKRYLAYRLVWELTNGEIQAGLIIRHSCDNNICCNPHHLTLGTQSDNEQDKYQNDRAGLPVGVVRTIRRLLLTTELTQSQIAQHIFDTTGIDVSRSAVRDIKNHYRRARGGERTMEEILAEKDAANVKANEAEVQETTVGVEENGHVGSDST